MPWTLGSSDIHAGIVHAEDFFVDGNATSIQTQLSALTTSSSTLDALSVATSAQLSSLEVRVAALEAGGITLGTSPTEGSGGGGGITVTIAPTYEYNFIESGVSFNDPTLTFADGTNTATANVTGAVTWSSSNGVTTTPNGALQLTSFQTGGACSIEWYGTLDNIHSTNWQKIWSLYDSTTVNLSLCRWMQTNSIMIQHNEGGHRATTSLLNILAPGAGLLHVVCTISSAGNKVIYLNGTASSTESNTLTPFTTQTYTNHFIGRDAWDDTGTETTRYFAFYNSELSSNDVTAVYQAAQAR